MSVHEHDQKAADARRHLLEGYEDPNEYNAEMAWLALQPID